jgi:hypothetical protein
MQKCVNFVKLLYEPQYFKPKIKNLFKFTVNKLKLRCYENADDTDFGGLAQILFSFAWLSSMNSKKNPRKPAKTRVIRVPIRLLTSSRLQPYPLPTE